MPAGRRLKVLFLCTGNSCRSQMAEGWARHLAGDAIEPYSAGIEAKGLDPLMVQVMEEAGVKMASHRSKTVEELGEKEFDYVITLCNHARETCPCFPGKAKVIHHGFPDPPLLAKEAASKDEALKIYRKVRDEIRAFVEALPEILNALPSRRDQPA